MDKTFKYALMSTECNLLCIGDTRYELDTISYGMMGVQPTAVPIEITGFMNGNTADCWHFKVQPTKPFRVPHVSIINSEADVTPAIIARSSLLCARQKFLQHLTARINHFRSRYDDGLLGEERVDLLRMVMSTNEDEKVRILTKFEYLRKTSDTYKDFVKRMQQTEDVKQIEALYDALNFETERAILL